MSARRARSVAALIFTLILGVPASGAAEDPAEESLFAGLRFRSIGPAVMGGRIDDVAVVESRLWVFYVATASGGLWKTTNQGTTWESIFDGQGTSSIGDVAVASSDSEIVWVGTGEPNNRQSSTFGAGVYKSVDGGKTWEHKGLVDTHHIGRVVIHPRDPDVVYVAALGHLWGPNEQRGVFRTTDGGKQWEKVLFVDPNTGVSDLAMDPANPAVLYAAAYQRRRTPWGFNGGGSGSGLYRSTDGGETWKRLSAGLPEGPIGRIGLDVYRRDPRVVYALIESRDGGLFESQDRGESWTRINTLNPRPMYYSQIRVDPSDRRRIYVLGSSFHVSDDGGKNFRENEDMTPTYDVGVHGDHHALWVDPDNPRHLILGGDGGLYVSWDGSATWDKVNNIPLAQFYSVDVDMERPYNIYGGAQDTHSWGGPSATRRHIGILNGDWYQIHFGDGMVQKVDPTDPNIIYTESQGGNLIRFDRRTGDMRSIQPRAREGEEPYRFHWTSPLLISPHDAATIYLGGNRLFISTDRGETWEATPDLTRAENRDKLAIMGAFPDETTLSRHDGVSSWGTLTSIAESPITPGVIWVGVDDGTVQISRDGGRSWTNIDTNLSGLDTDRATVSRVVASYAEPGRAYLALDRHQLDDFAPYALVTEDYGQSWRSLSDGLPSDAGWVNVVIEHPRNHDLLFVGTETGLFVSLDRGEKWTRMATGFPVVPVDDLVVHPRDNDLIVGTHGRSIYILDDVTPLEQLDRAVMEKNVFLFDVRTSYEYLPWKHESYGGQRQFVGENPPFGALVTYYLRSAAEGEVNLAIRGDAGVVLRQLRGTRHAGLNRVVWDLRAEPPVESPRGRGPLVPPGTYTVHLSADGEELEKDVEVKIDPPSELTRGELRERFEFLSGCIRLMNQIQKASKTAESVMEQVDRFLKGAGQTAPEALRSGAGNVLEEAKRLRNELQGSGSQAGFPTPSLQRSITGLFEEIDGDTVRQGTFHGPTSTQRGRFASYEARTAEQLESLRRLVETSIPDLNRRIEEAGLPWIRGSKDTSNGRE